MARGWESKAVEAQIETSESSGPNPDRAGLHPHEAELLRRREGLLLSRACVLHDLASARSPRYRKILQETLEYLDHQLAQIADGRKAP